MFSYNQKIFHYKVPDKYNFYYNHGLNVQIGALLLVLIEHRYNIHTKGGKNIIIEPIASWLHSESIINSHRLVDRNGYLNNDNNDSSLRIVM